MKQVVARAGNVEVVDVPVPVCPQKGVLVATEWSLISTGTESWAIDSTEPLGAADVMKDSSMMRKAYRLSKEVVRQEGMSGLRDYVKAVRHPELGLGYSLSGTVVEVGKRVTDVVVGDRVACAGEGKASHAELVSVPRRLMAKVPDGLPMRQAAFTTVGAIALHAVRTGRLQIGESVGILGVGLVGNLVAQVAQASGCRVVSMDLRDDRLELAGKLTRGITLKSDDTTLPSHVLDFTSGIGLDCVFVCAATSSSEPIKLAAQLLRNRGRLVVVGRVGMDIERKDFYQKELKLLMTRSLGPGRYDPVYEEEGVDYPVEYVRWTLNRNMEAFMRLAKSGLVDVEGLIGGEFGLLQAAQAYQLLDAQSKVAVLLRYERVGSPELNIPRVVTERRSPPPGRINVALVGPGAFAKETIIPLMKAGPDFNLSWVVSSNPVHAKQLQARYKFTRSTCRYEDVLADKDVGLVVITSPNNLHSTMLVSAIEAGKLAFVEKPLCVTREEFEEVKRVQAKTKSPILVGFNRRYAPLILELKKRMDRMDGPFVLNCRVNAGFVQSGRWSQNPGIGGGRIIHECCHFFDLFNFLVGPGDPKISVEVAGITGSNSVARDNLSVSLRYPDGSLATLLYVAMGSKAMDRERLEVYGQQTSAVLDDFQKLTFYGGRKEVVTLHRSDKGHQRELLEVAKFSRGAESSVITTEEVFRATEMTFRVDELARGVS